jgi:hypothetical protein
MRELSAFLRTLSTIGKTMLVVEALGLLLLTYLCVALLLALGL